MNFISAVSIAVSAVLFLPAAAALAEPPADATSTNVGGQLEHGSMSATTDAATASTHPSPLLEQNLEATTPGTSSRDEATSIGLVDQEAERISGATRSGAEAASAFEQPTQNGIDRQTATVATDSD